MKVGPFTKTYDGRLILQVPEIFLEEGRIYAVIGANGSGKSTFARILAGIIPADQKKNVADRPCAVGYMPQKSHAFRMSTKKNILLGGSDAGRAKELMCQLGIEGLAGRRADRLSGGETARMALARTLMGKHRMVFLDEPTAAMDIASAALAEELMLRYQKETSGTLVVVTHSLRQARRLADQVLFFHQGKLLEIGAASQVLFEPENEETRRFLEFYGA